MAESFERNIKLAPFTTFKIGGKADYFFKAESKEGLVEALRRKKNLPFLILGKGSNILVPDEGFRGLAVLMEADSLELKDNILKAEAGVSLNSALTRVMESSLGGLEWAAGIPGTIGGAVVGNAGAFGESAADSLKQVEVLDSETLETKNIKKEDCLFSYRSSIFKKEKRSIVLSASFYFQRKEKGKIEEKIRENLEKKKETQPLEMKSAGSVFKNPESGPSAAFLIEKCQLKGERIGGAEISKKQANFIVNLKEASSKDVLSLMAEAKKKVKERFNIELKEEIEVIHN